MSAGALVTHERGLETREPSCVARTAKPFIIPVVHSPQGAVGHMATPELPSQEGRAQSPGTCGSARAYLSKDVRSRAAGHVTAPEPTLVRRRGSELRDTWWHRSSP
jgi:hypothetical protein